jgi:tight adherence protein C
VAESLRVFSDEMRDKRVIRAEESANKLPVKMVVPLGLFIFPVILMVVMLPLALRVMAALPH